MAADTKRGAGLDCGDSGCRYATERGGMRTNGGCRCDQCPLCEKGIRFGHREWCQFEARARHVLAAQGLYVVTAAEKAVLDACEAFSFSYWEGRGPGISGDDLKRVIDAELARREAAKLTEHPNDIWRTKP